MAQERQGNILSTLHQILTPFLLRYVSNFTRFFLNVNDFTIFFYNYRRVKADVDLKIPPKKEVIVYCPMTETQSTFYKATVDQTIAAMVQDDDKKGNNVFYVNSIFRENYVKLTFFVNYFSDVPLIDDGPRKKRAAANRIDFKAILQEDDDEISDKKFEKYLETIQQMESQRANSMTSAYNPKVITVSRNLYFTNFS